MKDKYPVLVVTLVAILVRIAWIAYTGHVAEDAHITFQFARNVYRYGEFSINHGFPIYGSTTPLLTLLLSGWLIFSSNIVLGAWVLNILASAGGVALVAISDKKIGVFAASMIAIFPKIVYEDTQGMETPFILLFMAATLYFSSRKPVLSGIAAGLLLWTRVDLALFVLVFMFMFRGRDILKYIAGTTIYIPWLIFSYLYFGSVVPFTITAKQVAYGMNNPPYPVHLDRISDYLGPILVFAVIGAIASARNKKYLLISIFVVLHGAMLISSGATFFSRYFYPILIACIVLSASIVSSLSDTRRKFAVAICLVSFSAYSLFVTGDLANHAKDLQSVRYSNLRQIGEWMNRETKPGAKVMLEPLGYVGYYADRFMLDEVGLVTPPVVDLKLAGISGEYYFKYIPVDYVILSCGQSEKIVGELQVDFELGRIFDGHGVRSCYEIWRKK